MPSNGFRLIPSAISPSQQGELMAEITRAMATAPLRHNVTPGGRRMSVAMTSLGALGWTSDQTGYRYRSDHPDTGLAWPPMPPLLVTLWRDLTGRIDAPDSCLVNHYGPKARMSLHQDRDEADLTAPVVSISLGDTALFRIGGQQRSAPTVSVRLSSGDVCILDGDARLAFHGIDRILPGSSRLVPGGGRINLTRRLAGKR
jgi:alkylated DNA repair protein (DNA oxidative demethylase)